MKLIKQSKRNSKDLVLLWQNKITLEKTMKMEEGQMLN